MSRNVAFGMCTKDEEDSILKTVRAIRRQTRKPDYIFVCDASTDSTPDIIREELAKSSIDFEVFRQNQYSGHGGARQELYEHVRTVDPDVFCMIDADNTINEDWLEKITDFWEEHPEYDAITGPDCSRDVHRKCVSPHDPLYYRHASIALDTSLVEAIGGWDPNFNRGEDWDFALRMYRYSADVFTSSQWCSRYLNTEPPGIDRKRIAGNPTSVPYLSKYGFWYAKFHPIQIIKDVGSVLFYMFCIFTILISLLAPQYASIAAGAVLFYGLSYIFGAFHYSQGADLREFKRALFLLLYTTPAVLRSLKKIIRSTTND